MLRYLVSSSIEQYPELSAFLKQTDRDELQEQALSLKGTYILAFSIPIGVIKAACSYDTSSLEGDDEQVVTIQDSVPIEEIVAYFGGFNKLMALLGESLLVKEGPNDFYLSSLLSGRKEVAQVLTHLALNTTRSPAYFQTTLISQLATAMLFNKSPEEAKLIVQPLLEVFDHPEIIFHCLLAKQMCKETIPSFDAAIAYLLKTAPVSTTIDCGSYQQITDLLFVPDWNAFADMVMRTDGLRVKVTFGTDQLNPETADRFSRHTQAVDSQRSEHQKLSVFASSRLGQRAGGPASANSVHPNC